jgi:hypothetical protein
VAALGALLNSLIDICLPRSTIAAATCASCCGVRG